MTKITAGTTVLVVWNGSLAMPAVATRDFEAEVLHFAGDEQNALTYISTVDADGNVDYAHDAADSSGVAVSA